jgi:hypothetical protein
MSDPHTVLNQLDRIRAETLQRFEPLSQEQLDRRPAPGDGEQAWSLGEIFMHLALDEHYLREHIARPLLEGISPPDEVRFLPPPPPLGAKKAPNPFRFDRAREMTRRLLEGWPENANLNLQHAGGLEPMNGLEWLAAYGGHEAFHHRQIDALLEQAGEHAHVPA